MDHSNSATSASPRCHSTQSQEEKRVIVPTQSKVDPVWIKEPDWVKRRMLSKEQTSSQSHLPQGYPPLPAGPVISPQAYPLPQHTNLPPQPRLRPLLFTNTRSQQTDSRNKESMHAAWWAQISNNLASYSVRSYQLFLASNFVTCKAEELMLLYEVRKLNAGGEALFKDILRGLRVRAANWEGNMDELRISWDMRAKLEKVKVHDELVAEQLVNLERELREDASESSDNDAQTVSTAHIQQEKCDFEDSGCGGPLTEISQSEEDAKSIVDMGLIEVKDNTLNNHPTEEPTTGSLTLSYEHVTVEVLQDKCQLAVPKSAIAEPLADTVLADTIPSSSGASLNTWAKVVASSVQIYNSHPVPRKRSVTRSSKRCSKKWGAVSGAAWEWDRKWKGSRQR